MNMWLQFAAAELVTTCRGEAAPQEMRNIIWKKQKTEEIMQLSKCWVINGTSRNNGESRMAHSIRGGSSQRKSVALTVGNSPVKLYCDWCRHLTAPWQEPVYIHRKWDKMLYSHRSPNSFCHTYISGRKPGAPERPSKHSLITALQPLAVYLPAREGWEGEEDGVVTQISAALHRVWVPAFMLRLQKWRRNLQQGRVKQNSLLFP